MKTAVYAAGIGAMLLATQALEARAAEPERVVVRNRKYVLERKLELSASLGLTAVDYFTRHTNVAVAAGYNVTEELGFELGAGWTHAARTVLAEQVSEEVVRTDPSSKQKIVSDFEDLWQMSWNAVGLLRWAPIYGKLNVAAELPVHFKAYLLAGGGVAGLQRDSLVYCIGKPASRAQATCSPDASGDDALVPLHDDRLKPLLAGGFGLRLFLGKGWGTHVEVRDYAFPDSYRVQIARASAETDLPAASGGDAVATQGVPEANPGFTHLVFVQWGATYSF